MTNPDDRSISRAMDKELDEIIDGFIIDCKIEKELERIEDDHSDLS